MLYILLMTIDELYLYTLPHLISKDIILKVKIVTMHFEKRH